MRPCMWTGAERLRRPIGKYHGPDAGRHRRAKRNVPGLRVQQPQNAAPARGAPGDTRELMTGFVEQAAKLRADPPADLMCATDALLSRLFEDGKAMMLEREAQQPTAADQ